MNSNRDAHFFGEDIFAAIYKQRDDEDVAVSASLTIRAAKNLMEQGYHKQRIVTSRLELSDVPVDAIVRDSKGDVFERAFEYDQKSWVVMADVALFDSDSLQLPVTVLWEPNA